MTATSAPTAVLTARHAPTSELVARSNRPGGPRSLMEEWARLKARQPLVADLPPGPLVVALPKHLLN